MTNRITYRDSVSHDYTSVFIDGKHVGTIRKSIKHDGWIYTPKGGKPGTPFKTIHALKVSLELDR